MGLEQVLLQLGLSVSSSAIYDLCKRCCGKSKSIDIDVLKRELASFLKIDGADIAAEKIINFMAINGDIEVNGSKVYAKNSILYSSGKGTKFSLEKSRSETEKTRIDVGEKAKIEGQGGAEIRQNEDGSISFFT